MAWFALLLLFIAPVHFLTLCGATATPAPAITTPLATFALPPSTGTITSVAFNPATGTEIVAGSTDTTVTLWNKLTGAQIRQFSGHTGSVQQVVFNPRNAAEILSAAGTPDNTVRLWNAQTGQPIRVFNHGQPLVDVAFNPLNDSEILSSASDGSVKLWHKDTATVIQTFSGLSGSLSISYSHTTKGTFLVCADQVRLYDATGPTPKQINSAANVAAFNWANGNEVLTAASDNIARLWDVTSATAATLRTFVAHNGTIKSLTYNPANSSLFLTSSADGSALMWNKDSGQMLRKFVNAGKRGTRAAFNPQNATELVVGYEGNTLLLWSLTQLPPAGPAPAAAPKAKESMTTAILIYAIGLSVVVALTAFAVWKLGLLKPREKAVDPLASAPAAGGQEHSEFHDLRSISDGSRTRSGSGSPRSGSRSGSVSGSD